MVKSNFFTSCLDFKGSMSIPLVKQTNTNGETKQETLQIKRKTLNFLTYWSPLNNPLWGSSFNI